MSFRMEKLPLKELPDYAANVGPRYERVLIAAAQPTAWRVAAAG